MVMRGTLPGGRAGGHTKTGNRVTCWSGLLVEVVLDFRDHAGANPGNPGDAACLFQGEPARCGPNNRRHP
jgi:hypothetical protein